MFQNDPKVSDLPSIGNGSADIAVRTFCGKAAVYDGKHPEALADFVGDVSLRLIDGKLYRPANDGGFTPVVIPSGANVVFVPPAGDWQFLTEAQLTQEYAICVADKLVVKRPVRVGNADDDLSAAIAEAAALKAASTKKAAVRASAASKK